MLRHILPFLFVLPPLIYGILSLVCTRSFFRVRKSPEWGLCLSGEIDSEFRAAGGNDRFHPPVSILKPVKGMDAESFENFASFCRQIYPRFQIIFAAASADDPVIPVIRQLIASFPEVDIDLVVDGRIYGPNYKVCNLINAFPLAKYDIVIVCDSDIRVVPVFLQEVCEPFSDPQVGLVTSLYRSPGVKGAPTAIESLGFTTEMIPNVMVALKLEGLSFALGASMAVRREALEKIGGFSALVDYLADDYQLGNMTHKAGYRLELSACYVESVMHRESLATVLSRQLRWARTMRVSRPGGYLASGITQPVPAAVIALIVSGGSMAGLGAVIALYAVRSVVALLFSRLYVRDGLLPRYLWLLPVRDLFAFGTWALAFLGNRVRWRGHLYLVEPGGKLKEL